MLLEMEILFAMDSSTYDSATVVLFHPPCLFRDNMSPPASTRMVAEDLMIIVNNI
jgi:hypothetical protein